MKRKILKLKSAGGTCTFLKDGRTKVEVHQNYFNEKFEWVFWLPNQQARINMTVDGMKLIKDRLLRDFAVDVDHLVLTYRNEV